MKICHGNRQIFMKWLDEWQRALIEQGYPYSPGEDGIVADTMKAKGAFGALKVDPPSANVPTSSHFQMNAQWIDSSLRQLFDFNAMGNEYICSTTEAVLKCNGLKDLVDQFAQPYYYRGEHVFGWNLVSRLGREIEIDWETEDPYKVTQIELDLLNEFQKQHKAESNIELPPDNHPGWWSIMQHYDRDNGTRLIDLTSSIYCALYFSCASLSGDIDTTVDGKLWAFPYPPGRGETDNPDRISDVVNDFDDERRHTADDYFSLEARHDTPRFRRSPIRNDRAIAQDGYFVWQPKFDQVLQTFQHFPFRVHRDYKKSIVKELAAMGYTRERLLAEHMC